MQSRQNFFLIAVLDIASIRMNPSAYPIALHLQGSCLFHLTLSTAFCLDL